jgi:hypothetical protein
MSHLALRCALAVAALAAMTPPVSAQSRVQVGILECRGAATVSFIVGSVHRMACVFRSSTGRRTPYHGVIRRAGLDVGFTQRSVLRWAVFAPTRRIGPGDLAGTYGGVSAGAAVGAGASANALVGGSANSIGLQPLSVEGQTGLNVALGIASFELIYGDEAGTRRVRRHRHHR